MRSNHSDPRPWAIRRWCLWSSVLLATFAELALIGAAMIAFASANRNPGVLVLPLIWPVFYALVYGFSYAIAGIDQRGPAMANFSQRYRDQFPELTQRFLNAMYPIGSNLALLLFPMMASWMSGAVLWLAANGRLNP